MPKNVQMTLGEGRLSDDIRSVAPKRAIAVDVTTSAQIALHLPAPISVDIRL